MESGKAFLLPQQWAGYAMWGSRRRKLDRGTEYVQYIHGSTHAKGSELGRIQCKCFLQGREDLIWTTRATRGNGSPLPQGPQTGLARAYVRDLHNTVGNQEWLSGDRVRVPVLAWLRRQWPWPRYLLTMGSVSPAVGGRGPARRFIRKDTIWTEPLLSH